ncbi:DUF1403 family protein [Mesorhizobium sp. SARCC-RB16n]|uniref:DUF1403 family protein n=1 Tax=Mesorhizobium sp. SARCC-RB16n TaxID=2116687 RepID=UPI00358E1891
MIAQVFAPAFRTEAGGGKRIRPEDKSFERAVCVALALAAADACRLAAELSRRAEKLVAVAPKLRANGAAEVIFLLLNEDAVSGSLVTKNLSRFAARRLFERLQQLEAVRELSGRPSLVSAHRTPPNHVLEGGRQGCAENGRLADMGQPTPRLLRVGPMLSAGTGRRNARKNRVQRRGR